MCVGATHTTYYIINDFLIVTAKEVIFSHNESNPHSTTHNFIYLSDCYTQAVR